MEITIFAKKRTSQEGRKFFSYLTTLPRKDGTEETMSVKFRDECGAPRPEECPCNIIIQKGDANVSKRNYVREDTGETGTSKTLWVTAWSKGSVYVDTSMDEYDI